MLVSASVRHHPTKNVWFLILLKSIASLVQNTAVTVTPSQYLNIYA